jgi:hypothetical protein
MFTPPATGFADVCRWVHCGGETQHWRTDGSELELGGAVLLCMLLVPRGFCSRYHGKRNN